MKIKVFKNGNVTIDPENGTYKRHYDKSDLCEVDWFYWDRPHWPYHVMEKPWATDADKIVDAQAKIIAMFPKEFAWLRPDWRLVVARDLAKKRLAVRPDPHCLIGRIKPTDKGFACREFAAWAFRRDTIYLKKKMERILLVDQARDLASNGGIASRVLEVK